MKNKNIKKVLVYLKLFLIFFVVIIFLHGKHPCYGANLEGRSVSNIVEMAIRSGYENFDRNENFQNFLNDFGNNYTGNDHANDKIKAGIDYTNNLYFEAIPSIVNPYGAGRLKSKPILDAENAVKLARYIAGVDFFEMEFLEEYNNSAQHKSVIAAATAMSGHNLTKPSDMSDEFFDSSKNNGAELSYSVRNVSLSLPGTAEIITIFLGDPGFYNVSSVGHRLALLNPSAESYGIGYANDFVDPLYENQNNSFYSNYFYVHSDGDCSNTGSHDLFCWPAAGSFPIEYFQNTSYPWSVSLGTGYMEPKKSEIEVKITRERDERSWVFNHKTLDLGTDEESYKNQTLDHLAIHNNNIIFRPNLYELGDISEGDTFIITISGVKDIYGIEKSIEYQVSFFDLSKEVDKFVSDPGSAPTEPKSMQITNVEPAGTRLNPINGEIAITFNNDIDIVVEDRIKLHRLSTGENIDISAQVLVSSEKILRLTSKYNLGYEEAYKLIIEKNAIRGKNGEYFEGLDLNNKYEFNTTLPIVNTFYDTGESDLLTSYPIDYLVEKNGTLQYNPEISSIMSGFSKAAYNEKTILKALASHGFHENYYSRFNDLSEPAFAIGKKYSVDGTVYVIISVRGSESVDDFITDFTLVPDKVVYGQHTGFSKAKDYLKKNLYKFLEDDFSDENIKSINYILTGHSYGGAVVNLLAADLIDNSDNKKNICAYTYGSPKVITLIGNKNKEDYNIYNIINIIDPITTFPPGYSRYGSKISYYDYDLKPKPLRYHAMIVYLENMARKKSEKAMLDEITISKKIVKFVIALIQCPVDVDVYDEEGHLVVQLINNEVKYLNKDDTDIILFIDGDSKYLISTDSINYKFEIKATDKGNLNYSVKEYDAINESIVEEKTYSDIELVEGKTFISNIGKDLKIEDTPLLVKEGDNLGREVRADGSENNDIVYYDDKGIKQYGWVKDQGKWYYMDSDGTMKIGWVKDRDKWYYLNSVGIMQTDSHSINGKIHTFSPSGVWQGNWERDSRGWWFKYPSGFYPKNTWAKLGYKWYYFNESGYMRTGWLKIGDKWYYLKGSGAMATGWTKVESTWYFMNVSGDMRSGWLLTGGKWYYLNPGSGTMVTGWKKVGGKWYFFYENGSMAENTWVGEYWVDENGVWEN